MLLHRDAMTPDHQFGGDAMGIVLPLHDHEDPPMAAVEVFHERIGGHRRGTLLAPRSR